MRAVFYSEDEVKEAYSVLAPKLRRHANACRLRNPLPRREQLSAAESEQYRILHDILTQFRATPLQFPWPYLEIYHGSPITLLAAMDVFGAENDSVVLLLSAEREAWFKESFQGADGWFGSCWVTMHDVVPSVLTRLVASVFPKPDGFCYWILTKARRGRATHEAWKWDGAKAQLVGGICETLTEEGFIDDFGDLEPASLEFLWGLREE